jgi:GAF domain-containing protein
MQLVRGVQESLRLASAGIFRKQHDIFRRIAADHTWHDATPSLDPSDPLMAPAQSGHPYSIDLEAARRHHFPDGLVRPILAVPVGDRLRCLAVALYGLHASGNALSHEERSMLKELANKAASALMQINDVQLRRRIAELEGELATKAAELSRREPPLLAPR